LFEYDPTRTALIGIDLQEWTVGMPGAPRSGDDVVSTFSQIARALKSVGGTIALTRAAFSAGYADLLKAPVDIPLRVPEGGLSERMLAFKEPIATLDADIIITKRQWSAFYGTELDLQLRRRNITTLIVAGVMTNFGVESTARDAWQNNYATLVAEDACASLDADMHAFAIDKLLPRVARIRPSSHFLETFR